MTESTKFLETGGWGFLFAAWVISLLSTFGALFTGEVMGQTPCLLCWYQRAFMFPLTVILAVACFRSDLDVWRYALPVATIGWAIAAYHALFYVGAIPEAIEPCGVGPSCSGTAMTVLGVLPIPLLSVGAFTAIIALLVLLRRRNSA